MTTMQASPKPESERAEDRTKPAAAPRKAWNKPVVKRIYDGLFQTGNGGPPSGSGQESPTYTHVS